MEGSRKPFPNFRVGALVDRHHFLSRLPPDQLSHEKIVDLASAQLFDSVVDIHDQDRRSFRVPPLQTHAVTGIVVVHSIDTQGMHLWAELTGAHIADGAILPTYKALHRESGVNFSRR